MSDYRKVLEFHQKFGAYIGKPGEKTPDEIRNLRRELITEEFNEILRAFQSGNDNNLIKELCDLIYVVQGTFVALGIDGDKAFDIVHESNMSKLGIDGKPLLREDGKILKGPNYRSVNEDEDFKTCNLEI